MDSETITISKFKATCLELLRKVKQTGQPLVVTRNGEPLAMITPPPIPEKPLTWLGAFQSTGEIKGDILSPVMNEKNWSVMGS